MCFQVNTYIKHKIKKLKLGNLGKKGLECLIFKYVIYFLKLAYGYTSYF